MQLLLHSNSSHDSHCQWLCEVLGHMPDRKLHHVTKSTAKLVAQETRTWSKSTETPSRMRATSSCRISAQGRLNSTLAAGSRAVMATH